VISEGEGEGGEGEGEGEGAGDGDGAGGAGAGEGAAGAGEEGRKGSDEGCSCAVERSAPSSPAVAWLLVGLLWLRRRR